MSEDLTPATRRTTAEAAGDPASSPRKFYRLLDHRNPGEQEFWPEGRRGASQPGRLGAWERCLWDCGTSVFAVLEDAEEIAPHLEKRFWVLLDLDLAPPGQVAALFTGPKSHYELIGRPGYLRSLRVGEGRVRAS